MYERIRELRRERGISQKELGGVIHVSQQTVSRIENGVYALPVDILIRLSVYFQVSSDYILNLTDVRTSVSVQPGKDCTDSYLKRYFRIFEMLDRKNQDLISKLVIELLEKEF